MSAAKCTACFHRFQPDFLPSSTCPKCGGPGPFRIVCWRCKSEFIASNLCGITCDACKSCVSEWSLDFDELLRSRHKHR